MFDLLYGYQAVYTSLDILYTLSNSGNILHTFVDFDAYFIPHSHRSNACNRLHFIPRANMKGLK